MNDEEDRPVGDIVDLDAWEPQCPPSDFAARVLARVQEEDGAKVVAPKSRLRRTASIGGGVLALSLAAGLLLRMTTPASQGEAVAKERTEVLVGARALAVLEPGASVRWNGDDVVQAHGDVFYRVEPGARFTVHTPAGDVEVKGTCFAVKVRPRDDGEAVVQKRDLKSGGIGAALSALAFVAVYEGKVAVSHAGQRVELTAGETARTGAGGVTKSGTTADGEKALAADLANAEPADPTARANQNLVSQVSEYRSRLEAIALQKSELETKLKNAEARISTGPDGTPVVRKHEFDLSTDDWKQLAKDGTVKYRLPCFGGKQPWSPSPEKLQHLGLAPQDASTIKSAYERSNQRIWATVKPLCMQVAGSAELAEKLGISTCIHLVVDNEHDRESGAVTAAKTLVGEIRAGTRPMPGPNEPLNPVAKMFLATTGETPLFEADLAQSLGPEEARRIVYSDDMCMQQSTFGGAPKPAKP